MLTSSFIFLPKISYKKEKQIWDSGIHKWDDFLAAEKVSSVNPLRKKIFDNLLIEAQQQLHADNAKYFSKLFPNQETWRLYNHFKENTCYLDIETSGYYGDVTVVGISDGVETKTMVKGINLDAGLLKKTLAEYQMIVTFNGSSFDLPVIKRYLGEVIPAVPHVDLRHCCSRIGLTGGLKKIEKELGIKRADEVAEMQGSDAVYLWQMWKTTGNRKYLDLLVQYNEEDILNLKPLAEYTYKNLQEKLQIFKSW